MKLFCWFNIYCLYAPAVILDTTLPHNTRLAQFEFFFFDTKYLSPLLPIL